MLVAGKWLELEMIISQAQKAKCQMLFFCELSRLKMMIGDGDDENNNKT
jgi:hypothetical protein